jgi:hypothetical protein
MSDLIFQDAYARVRSRYSNQEWVALSPREVTTLIYQEMREIDLNRSIIATNEAHRVIAVAAE